MPGDGLIDILLGLRRVPSPTEVPLSTLIHWRIFRANGASNHFVGIATNGLVRTSTDIVQFDASAMIGITLSGRFYLLKGLAGEGDDAARAELAFARWALSFGLHSIQDVTEAFLADPENQRGITQ